jgi:hypothetical protein
MRLLSLLIPKVYGGNKVDTISYNIVVENSPASAAPQGIVAAHNSSEPDQLSILEIINKRKNIFLRG